MSSIDWAGDHLVLATFSNGRPLTSATQAGGAKWWWMSIRLGFAGAAAWNADNRGRRTVAARPSEVAASARNFRRARSVTTHLVSLNFDRLHNRLHHRVLEIDV